jgi:hypothetical protein
MTSEIERLKRKANQEWDMAGLAAQDGDGADCARHTKLAQDYDRQIREWREENGSKS